MAIRRGKRIRGFFDQGNYSSWRVATSVSIVNTMSNAKSGVARGSNMLLGFRAIGAAELPDECVAVNPEEPGRFRLIVMCLPERLPNRLVLPLL